MYKQLALYLLAVLTINLIPGPDMLYIIGQSLSKGKRFGMAAVFGTTAGCFIHIFAISIGLSAILFKSSSAFSIVKYVGACYLIFLGITEILKKQSFFINEPNQSDSHKSIRSVFSQGFFVDVLNPKVALFFLAFLPQFVLPSLSYPLWMQMLALGLIFNLSSTIVNTCIVYGFGYAQKWFAAHPFAMNAQQKVFGCILVGLGLRIAAFEKV